MRNSVLAFVVLALAALALAKPVVVDQAAKPAIVVVDPNPGQTAQTQQVVTIVGTSQQQGAQAQQVAQTQAQTQQVVVKPVEVKPVEVKPVEVKPIEVKPVEVKPQQPIVIVKPVDIKPQQQVITRPVPPKRPIMPQGPRRTLRCVQGWWRTKCRANEVSQVVDIRGRPIEAPVEVVKPLMCCVRKNLNYKCLAKSTGRSGFCVPIRKPHLVSQDPPKHKKGAKPAKPVVKPFVKPVVKPDTKPKVQPIKTVTRVPGKTLANARKDKDLKLFYTADKPTPKRQASVEVVAVQDPKLQQTVVIGKPTDPANGRGIVPPNIPRFQACPQHYRCRSFKPTKKFIVY